MNIYSPRLASLNLNKDGSASIAKPASVGKVLPTDPVELMRYLKTTMNKKNLNQKEQDETTRISSRLLKQELQIQSMELKFMGYEDYTFSDEGARRKIRQMEEILMIEEDMKSQSLQSWYKEQKKLKFREKIRADAEALKQQELLIREEKKKAAEEKRRIVIEKIRQEEREEEERLLKIKQEEEKKIAENERIEQEIINKLKLEQVYMNKEDNLSYLWEQNYREELEIIKWKKEEKIKLEEWELQQKENDLKAAKQLEERSELMKEKKAKLEALRSKQKSLSQEDKKESEANKAKELEEATKLNKQLRIQNKAKYMSKCIKTNVVVPDKTISNISSSLSLTIPEAIVEEVPSIVVINSQILIDYQKYIQEVTSEIELKNIQKELLNHKRKLRLELNDNKSFIDYNSESINNKIIEVNEKEKLIQNHLNNIVSSKDLSKTFRVQSPSKKSTANLLKDVMDDIGTPIVFETIDEPLIIPTSSVNKIVCNEEIIVNKVEKNSTNETSIITIQDSPKLENKKDNDIIEIKLDLSLIIQTNKEKEDLNDVQSSSLVIIVDEKENNENNENIVSLIEEDDNEDVDVDFDSFKSINGWEECLQTTMSSAAHHAAFNGFDEVLDVLSQYFDCFVMDSKGRTPLFYAALKNQLSCVSCLVAIDPQWIDVGDESGDTPIHAATIGDSLEVLKFLLSCEASADTANFKGLTPSHLARTSKTLEVLFDAGAILYCVDSLSRMPLHLACVDGRVDCVKYLCSIVPHDYIFWGDSEGDSPLHLAALNGHDSCVEIICQSIRGIEDLSILNNKQQTPAHVASNILVLNTLYSFGSDLWISDAKQRYPIFMQSFYGRADCVAFLMDIIITKANSKKTYDYSRILAKDFQGDTCLHIACIKGHLQVLALLLFIIRNEENSRGLKPSNLAEDAGFSLCSSLCVNIEDQIVNNIAKKEIFGSDNFDEYSSIIINWGSRWNKIYDYAAESYYYFDRITNQSQWEMPLTYDEQYSD